MFLLAQPSIISLCGSDARLLALYMPYLPYPDLAAQRDRRAGHFFEGTRAVAKMVYQDIASALEYLEKKYILHNDIKPSNIVFGAHKRPLLIDFGLASTIGTRAVRAGTPWYMPDEYMNRDQRGAPSNVFGLSVTILYLLREIPLPDATGRSRRVKAVPMEKYGPNRAAMEAWLMKVQGVRKTLRGEFESIVRAGLNKNPEKRISA